MLVNSVIYTTYAFALSDSFDSDPFVDIVSILPANPQYS